MVRKAIVLSAALLLLPCVLSGANVQWNYLDEMEMDWIYSVHEHADGSLSGVMSIIWPYVDMDGPIEENSITLLARTHTYMEFGSMICVANAGDIASVESIEAKGSYLYYGQPTTNPEDNARADYPITLERGESVYLEFIAMYDSIPGKEVGWFELAYDMDGNLSVVRSAIDTDGDPLVVGYIIPEPTGGTLLLLGAAALLLRRRKSKRGRS